MTSVNKDAAIVHCIIAFQKKPHCARSLSIEADLHKERAARLIRIMYDRGLIYIAEWKTIGLSKNWYPYYSWKEGKEVDAVRPKPQTKKEAAMALSAARAARHVNSMVTRKETEV